MIAENKRVPINQSDNCRAQLLHLKNTRDFEASNGNQLDLHSDPNNSIETHSGDNSKRFMRFRRVIKHQTQ